MKRIVRLTENDLTRIVKRVLKEQVNNNQSAEFYEDVLLNRFFMKVAPKDQYINNVKKYLKELSGRGFDEKMEDIKNALPTLEGKIFR